MWTSSSCVGAAASSTRSVQHAFDVTNAALDVNARDAFRVRGGASLNRVDQPCVLFFGYSISLPSFKVLGAQSHDSGSSFAATDFPAMTPNGIGQNHLTIRGHPCNAVGSVGTVICEPPKKLNQIKEPARTVLLCDGVDWNFQTTVTAANRRISGRHGRRDMTDPFKSGIVNVLHVDGHVAGYPRGQLPWGATKAGKLDDTSQDMWRDEWGYSDPKWRAF